MITIKDFMEVVNYKITEGSDYLWTSFGHNAYRLDSWTGYLNGAGPEYSIGIIFDTKSQVVYQFEAHDYDKERSYRWTNPEFLEEFRKESNSKLDEEHRDFAYDQVKFVELEVAEDIIEKAGAIVNGKEYDTRVKVPIDLDDAEVFQLMKLAHERDITLNKLVEEILIKVIEKENSKI